MVLIPIANTNILVLKNPLAFNLPALVLPLNSFMIAPTFGLIFRSSFGIFRMLLEEKDKDQ